MCWKDAVLVWLLWEYWGHRGLGGTWQVHLWRLTISELALKNNKAQEEGSRWINLIKGSALKLMVKQILEQRLEESRLGRGGCATWSIADVAWSEGFRCWNGRLKKPSKSPWSSLVSEKAAWTRYCPRILHCVTTDAASVAGWLQPR